MSPPAHNAAFDATGYDGVYLPMRVDGSYESFKAFMETVVRYAPLQVRGLSITLPHKEHAIWYLQEHDATIEPLAQRIGAVNTIDVHEDGSLAGRNTDYLAILDPLKAEVGELVNTRVAVLGAGGTGRTAVAALASEGAEVVVLNRTGNRAQQLAAEFAPLARERGGDVSVAEWDTRNDGTFGIIINATTLGMFPNVDTSPLGDDARLGSTTVVFDCVYNPIETRLIRQARESGAAVIDGAQMFVRQAAAQFEGWTGLPAPVQAIRKEVESRLLKAAE